MWSDVFFLITLPLRFKTLDKSPKSAPDMGRLTQVASLFFSSHKDLKPTRGRGKQGNIVHIANES